VACFQLQFSGSECLTNDGGWDFAPDPTEIAYNNQAPC